MTIGVLALQGDFDLHITLLKALGETAVAVRSIADLKQCNGLIIPGGESTTLLILMQPQAEWFEALRLFAENHWIFGTCAGMILLAKHVQPSQPAIGLIDIAVARNAYGRQIHSFITTLDYKSMKHGVIETEVVFIRAPSIQSVGTGVQVLLQYEQTPILVQQNNIIVASFHPECASAHALYKDIIQRLQS